ncbi:FAD-dependent oxidoreductase [Cupriavidus basilensis]|uniref:FAD-dependent oxidoreductase n=1 Tax=Cupriavidus basilensis TaxID=68895 RepID=A0ABT6AR92_9BURK|nr:FAD-dependent oxidoreductase [Cupriavidus basilensis]MDF3834792.1 FAD-dependent oxidoreductase [Cupriavidus basilensis]
MDRPNNSESAIVVGAGIIGLSIALRLRMEGYQVTVIDKQMPMHGVSFGNAGYLSEANIFPPATPDLVRQLLKLMLDKEGPLVVRLSYACRLVPWAIRAMATLKPEPYKRVLSSMASLTSSAIAELDELTKEASAEHLVTRQGGLVVFKTEAALEAKCRALPVWNSFALAAERVSAAYLQELEPALSKDIIGGIYFPNAGRCSNPRGLGVHYAKRLIDSGALIRREEVRVVNLGASGEAEVVTTEGAYKADKVVVAAGYLSKDLLTPFGYKVPLAAERGYHLMLPSSQIELRRPVVFGEPFFAATPMDEGLRLAGTAEFAYADAKPNMARANMLLGLAKPYLPGINGLDAKPWMGVRPTFPDGMPAIGKVSGTQSVFYAFGHSHSGLTTSAITAKCVARLVRSAGLPIDVSAFSLDRFH